MPGMIMFWNTGRQQSYPIWECFGRFFLPRRRKLFPKMPPSARPSLARFLTTGLAIPRDGRPFQASAAPRSALTTARAHDDLLRQHPHQRRRAAEQVMAARDLEERPERLTQTSAMAPAESPRFNHGGLRPLKSPPRSAAVIRQPPPASSRGSFLPPGTLLDHHPQTIDRKGTFFGAVPGCGGAGSGAGARQ